MLMYFKWKYDFNFASGKTINGSAKIPLYRLDLKKERIFQN